jgi:glycosyltransferase involved in cell wall biosynthesis
VPRRIAFPGPTIARKGAHEVREAARALDLEVVLLGSELEGGDFWHGVRTVRPGAKDAAHMWLSNVAAVVQPAVVEERPRHLLAAVAAGVPVIATRACGLGEREGVSHIAPGDVPGLIAALNAVLAAS